MTISITTFSVMLHRIITLNIVIFDIMSLGIMTLFIMALVIMTLSLLCKIVTLCGRLLRELVYMLFCAIVFFFGQSSD